MAEGCHHHAPEDAYFALFECAPVAIWHEDFSDVKQYLEEIQASTSGDLHLLFAVHPEFVRECVARIRVLHVNLMARKFYGASTQQELVQSLPDLFDETALQIFAQEIETLASGAHSFEAELAARTLSGEERTVQMNVSLLPTPERPWSKVIVAFTDLTERKRLEAELLQAQKLESLGRLAGGVAHDMNNALTIINGYSEMLLSEAKTDAPEISALKEIRNAGERAAALTQQLLAFSRKQILQPVVADVNRIISEAEDVLRTAAGDHIDLGILLSSSPALARVDPGQFYHVLLNLVLNARDAMPHGGRIRIQTEIVELTNDTALEVKLRSGEYVCVTVQDTGIGMDETTQQHLFEPFYTTKGAGKGTGLGLSSALGIIQQSAGSIAFSSEPGNGSVFRVYLPVTGEALYIPAPSTAVDTEGCETILVVEDQPSVRGFLSGALRKFGYEVIEAANSQEALHCFEQHRKMIRVVVTDVIIPGIQGPELVRRMTALSPGLHAIYISGYAGESHAHIEEPQLQAVYLQKPFTARALASAVRNMAAAARHQGV